MMSWKSLGYSLFGVLIAGLLWEFLLPFFLNDELSKGFSPANTFIQLKRFVLGGELMRHMVPSLQREAIGLGIATLIGVPTGILVGYSKIFNMLTTTVFQFIRMTSPLAWMPLALIIFGVGSKPVYFLIAVATVWPIIINTAHGVQSSNSIWVNVVQTLGGDQWQVLRRAVIPAVVPDMLTGFRVSIGISWIILVPAEMLGVSSGLGYYILDTRDRFNYGELMAVILVIGLLGFLSDILVRLLQRRFSWREVSSGW